MPIFNSNLSKVLKKIAAFILILKTTRLFSISSLKIKNNSTKIIESHIDSKNKKLV